MRNSFRWSAPRAWPVLALPAALAGAAALSFLVSAAPAAAQPTPPGADDAPSATGRVGGAVTDALGRPLAGAAVSLQRADGTVVARSTSDADGRFSFSNVPLGTYALVVERPEFQSGTEIVTLSAGAASADRTLALTSTRPLDFEVAARQLEEARNRLNPQTGSSVYTLDRKALETLPQGENTPLNQALLQTPGMVQDSFGQIHLRGEHANLQYRINGIIIPESVNFFGQTFDTRFADRIDILTGALPAQYGYRTAGVVDIHTKTGTTAPGGRAELYGGSRDTFQPSLEYGGVDGRWSYYFEGNYLQSDLGIEAPTGTHDTLHDFTQQQKGFGYVSYLLNPTNRITGFIGASHSDFQIPNVPGLVGVPGSAVTGPPFGLGGTTAINQAVVDDRQYEQTYYAVVALQGTYGPWDYQLAPFARYTSLSFRPDTPGELVLNGVSQRLRRSDLAQGLQGDAAYKLTTNHTVRTGLFIQRERAVLDNTAAVFPADPADPTTQLSTSPFNITDNTAKVGMLYGVYLQDEWQALAPLTINYGARFDAVNAFTNENQISPRIGAVYKLTDDTSVHAGYARYFTPPPLELVSGKSVAAFAATTGAAPGGTLNDPVRAERSDSYDIGIVHRLTPEIQLGIDAYYKDITNMLDEGQFGPAVLFSPFNYRHGLVKGAEFTASYTGRPLSGYFNFGVSKALGKDIISGQAFIDPADLAYIHDHFIHTDHDQTYTISGGLAYDFKSTGTRVSADIIAGSGLRGGQSDIPNGASLPTYVTANLGVQQHLPDDLVPGVDVRLAVVNVSDEVYQIRSGTGIGVGAPQFGARRGFFVGLAKSF
jgi:outer membrane receptor protein involved in Fe transport